MIDLLKLIGIFLFCDVCIFLRWQFYDKHRIPQDQQEHFAKIAVIAVILFEIAALIICAFGIFALGWRVFGTSG